MCSSQTWWDHHPSKIHLIWVETVAAAKECSTPWLSQPLPWGTPQVDTKQLVAENQLVGWGENPFVILWDLFTQIWYGCWAIALALSRVFVKMIPEILRCHQRWRLGKCQINEGFYLLAWKIIERSGEFCSHVYHVWLAEGNTTNWPTHFEPWRLDHAGRAFDIICQCLENCEMDLSPKTCLDLIKWGFP